eukprot:7669734-Pyramimonas_sp.AAC.1
MLLNADRKLIATAANHELAAAAQREAAAVQRSFVRGRSFIPNIIHLDWVARALSGICGAGGGHPALLTFD